MAHASQIDGLPLDVPEDQEQEPSNRQDIMMMKGLINMMKQPLRHAKVRPPSKKELMLQQEDQ
eukprot:10933894-Prorocentrum_lima.AAC.1